MSDIPETDPSDRSALNRRTVLAAGSAAIAAGLGPSLAGASQNGADGDSEGATIELLASDANADVRLVEFDDHISVTQFHTDGPRKGELDVAEIGPAADVEVDRPQELETLGGAADDSATPSPEEVSLLSDGSEETLDDVLETQSTRIVERSSNIDRSLGEDCDENYCSGFTYTHGQTGVTFTLTKPADSFGKGTLATTIGALVTQYLSSPIAGYLGGFAGIIAGVVLSMGGETYTVSPYDNDYDGFISSGPEILTGVGNGWDLDPEDLQTVYFDRGEHLSHLDGRCG